MILDPPVIILKVKMSNNDQATGDSPTGPYRPQRPRGWHGHVGIQGLVAPVVPVS